METTLLNTSYRDPSGLTKLKLARNVAMGHRNNRIN